MGTIKNLFYKDIGFFSRCLSKLHITRTNPNIIFSSTTFKNQRSFSNKPLLSPLSNVIRVNYSQQISTYSTISKQIHIISP